MEKKIYIVDIKNLNSISKIPKFSCKFRVFRSIYSVRVDNPKADYKDKVDSFFNLISTFQFKYWNVDIKKDYIERCFPEYLEGNDVFLGFWDTSDISLMKEFFHQRDYNKQFKIVYIPSDGISEVWQQKYDISILEKYGIEAGEITSVSKIETEYGIEYSDRYSSPSFGIKLGHKVQYFGLYSKPCNFLGKEFYLLKSKKELYNNQHNACDLQSESQALYLLNQDLPIVFLDELINRLPKSNRKEFDKQKEDIVIDFFENL